VGSAWITYNLDDKAVLSKSLSTSEKVQILSSEQDLNLSNKLVSQFLWNTIKLKFQIKTINDQLRSTCLVGDQILWNNTVDPVVITDNTTYWNWLIDQPCYCKQEILVCRFDYTFDMTTPANWHVLSIPYNSTYINYQTTRFSTLDNKHRISFPTIGLSTLSETYSVTGNPQVVISHAITFIGQNNFDSLSSRVRAEVVGEVVTITFVKPGWSDYLTSYLALSFGAFGFITIVVRMFCFTRDSENTNSDRIN